MQDHLCDTDTSDTLSDHEPITEDFPLASDAVLQPTETLAREIIALQDKEYEESLRVDKVKVLCNRNCL